jgi:hypothetical protein
VSSWWEVAWELERSKSKREARRVGCRRGEKEVIDENNDDDDDSELRTDGLV